MGGGIARAAVHKFPATRIQPRWMADSAGWGGGGGGGDSGSGWPREAS